MTTTDVRFVEPRHGAQGPPTMCYIGDLARRHEYPDTSPVKWFTSIGTPRQNRVLSPLLALAHTTGIRIFGNHPPVHIEVQEVLHDVEGRIDDYLWESRRRDVACAYEYALQGLPVATISRHDCRVVGCGP